jgi:phospholipid/cholesterol/gamma-HCH transport system ATP-binding protein
MTRGYLATTQAAKAVGVRTTSLRRWVEQGTVRPTLIAAGDQQMWILDDLRRQLDDRVRPLRPTGQGHAIVGMSSPTGEFENVSKSFQGREVLKNVSLKIPGGQTTAVMGGSGSGKTVLARHLTGELEPSEGRVLISGESIWDSPREKWADTAQGLGVFFGARSTYDDRIDRSVSVLDNLALVLKSIEADDSVVERRALDWAREWDLEEVSASITDSVDSQSRHRLCLAQALVADPPLAIIDDPGVAVDIMHVDSEIQSIKKWRERTGSTILLTTHSLMFAKALAQQVAIMRDGEIIACGSTEEILVDVHDDATFEQRFNQTLSVRESDTERLRALQPESPRWRSVEYLDVGRARR